LIFLIESAWKVFTDTRISTPQTYLCVGCWFTESTGELFTSEQGSHAETKFMNYFKIHYDKFIGDKQRLPGNIFMYFTHSINCAEELRTMAKNYHFHWHIKVAALNSEDKELQDLIKSENLTVEAFKDEDYINLASYLGVLIIPQTTRMRDWQIEEGLKELKLRNTEDKTEDKNEPMAEKPTAEKPIA